MLELTWTILEMSRSPYPPWSWMVCLPMAHLPFSQKNEFDGRITFSSSAAAMVNTLIVDPGSN